jgi:mannosyl-3-phosphoglycerate phosphatase family protein
MEHTIEEPDGTKILVLGTPIRDLRTTLNQVVSRTGITYQSFYDMPIEQIAHITGLDYGAAKRAKDREFSETIITKLSPEDLEIFIRESTLHNLHCTFGGRFLSVIGKGADKGKAVQLLAKHFRSHFGDVVTIGIGDSPNDAPMLQEVDFPYLVQRPNGQWKNFNIDNLSYLPAIGPLGFSKMVKDIKRRWLNQK